MRGPLRIREDGHGVRAGSVLGARPGEEHGRVGPLARVLDARLPGPRRHRIHAAEGGERARPERRHGRRRGLPAPERAGEPFGEGLADEARDGRLEQHQVRPEARLALDRLRAALGPLEVLVGEDGERAAASEEDRRVVLRREAIEPGARELDPASARQERRRLARPDRLRPPLDRSLGEGREELRRLVGATRGEQALGELPGRGQARPAPLLGRLGVLAREPEREVELLPVEQGTDREHVSLPGRAGAREGLRPARPRPEPAERTRRLGRRRVRRRQRRRERRPLLLAPGLDEPPRQVPERAWAGLLAEPLRDGPRPGEGVDRPLGRLGRGGPRRGRAPAGEQEPEEPAGEGAAHTPTSGSWRRPDSRSSSTGTGYSPLKQASQ